jgi:hypothetical protein
MFFHKDKYNLFFTNKKFIFVFMIIRTSISLSTSAVEKAVSDVARLDFRNNRSGYIEELILKDLVNRGYNKEELLNDTVAEEKAN